MRLAFALMVLITVVWIGVLIAFARWALLTCCAS